MSFRLSAHRRRVAWVAGLVMIGSLLQATPAMARVPSSDNEPAVHDTGRTAPARPAPAVKPRRASAKMAAPAVVSWPVAAQTTLRLSAGKPSTGTVGGLSVSAAPVSPAKSAAKRAATAADPGAVRVETLDRTASTKAGVDGPVLGVARSAGAAAPIRMSVGYQSFAAAYGGDYGARLGLVQLPECALTTPDRADCRGRPLAATNNTATHTLTAQVPAAGARTLVGLAAGASSSQGSYGATSLAPSAKWEVAPSSGAFTWNYPITVPPVPGGQTPGVSLGYNSQTIDGRTATTNNQGSWVGEGFSYEPGYVERAYNACADDGHTANGDLCWAYDNATVLLNGKSSTLVRTGSTWRFASDDGSTIERATDTVNGDNNNEYWKITTTDGTKFFFGLNRLPGWTVNKEETGSVWTVPVFGDDAVNTEDGKVAEPCYNATLSKAGCPQAWRWNLDYVQDLHGNVTSYFYGKESNAYGLGGKTDVVGTSYTRGGFLKRIDYGQRAGAAYTSTAPARIVFDTVERCIPRTGISCGAGDLTQATALNWPDTPFDLICADGTKCKQTQLSPSFFTRKRLTGITTQVRSGTDWAPVDGWVFDHDFTNNADGSRSLWLKSITHSGYGGVKGAEATTLPSVVLEPLQLVNRIDIDSDNVGPLVRPRLSTVYTESGAQLDVGYADADCSAGHLPTPGRSTHRCYPVKWSPSGEAEPITDWFHKYVVHEVIETDRTVGAPDQVTRYDYQGDAGWRYADATGLSKDESKYLTWNQWRGYKTVAVTEGDGQRMTTHAEHSYLRGLDGDKDPDGGTRPEKRSDSTGAEYVDVDELAGFEIETQVFDGDTLVSKATTKPVRYETASVKHGWGTTDRATFVLPTVARAFSKLADGSWRETKQVTTYDPDKGGRVTQVDDLGDTSTATDDRCTRNYYADNATAKISSLIYRKETVAVNCAASPNRATQLIADERNYYDDNTTLGAAPTQGNVVRTETLKSHDGKAGTYISDAWSTFDAYGRPKVIKDQAGTATTVTYTEVNGLTTSKKEDGPLGSVTTEYATPWGQPLTQTDLNGKRTELTYDKLGRLATVSLPNRPRAGVATIKYSYSFVKDKPVSVKTEKLRNDGTYGTEFQIYDGFLRPRQIQAEGPDEKTDAGMVPGRLVADTFYTPTGQIAKTNDTYYAAGAPSAEILPSRNGDVDGQTELVYDALDRVSQTVTLRAGDERWRSITTYEGADRVSITPPTGETPTSTITDAAGHITELLQYKGNTPTGEADHTKYTYTIADKVATVTDQAGNVWKHTYDQRGRETETRDPDSGTTAMTYDDLDRVATTTDSRGITLTNTYDAVGRRLGLYQGDTKTGTLLSSWTYDSIYKGQLYASTRYQGADKYEVRYPSMDALYRPLETQYSIPKSGVGESLGGIYRFTQVYNTDGTLQSTGYPGAGDLSAETVVNTYDDLQRVTAVEGAAKYATELTYAQTGELLKTELSAGGRKAWATAEYEQGTGRLAHIGVTRQAIVNPGGPADPTPVSDVDQTFTYDHAGNVLSIEDTPGTGTRDIQCFQYDYLRRMTEAWTSASTADKPCTGGAEATGVGGVAPYHESFTFDAAGNRRTATRHAVPGAPEVSQDYDYPDAGPEHSQSHAMATMTETANTGTTLHAYKYDAAGNTIRRSEGGEDQDLSWDAEGNLKSVTKAGQTTSYVYSADNERLVRKEPGTTTLYLGGQELRLKNDGSTVTGTRFYQIGDQASVVRSGSALQFQFTDQHATGQVAVDAITGAITHRRTDPYGNDRGSPPAAGAWAGEKGFVGGNKDDSTGLTQLGNRLYDPRTGKFISVDPLIDPNDPQSMNAYSYAQNTPVTASDPSGLAADFCATLLCAQQTGGVGCVDCTSGAQYAAGYQTSDGKPTGRGPSGSGGSRSSGESPEVAAARARAAKAKQMLIEAGKALGKIAMDELGITDALDCVTKGNIGACVETVLNIAGAFVGGMVAKIARKYGAPWKWKKAAELGKKLWDLGGKIIDGIKSWMKESKLVSTLIRRTESCLNSFASGTLVLLADGSTRRIEDLKVGDQVRATDPATGETVAKEVTATHINLDAEFTDLVIVDAAGRASTLHTTQHHPFWDASTGAWTDAGDLPAGDLLQSPTGERVRVTEVANFTGAYTMYNLTVDDLHTYYVLAGDVPVLVHNCPVAIVDSAKYPESAQHILDAQAAGHPSVLTIARGGAKQNRRDSLRGIKKVAGKQLDEYPPAMFAEGGQGASVRAITPGDNGGAGAAIGNQLRRYKNGTKVLLKVI